MGNYTNDSFLNIRRYLNKQMTSTEMHAFEKTLMEDPFLADAFEGYITSNPEKDGKNLEAIETQLLSKKEPAKVVAFASTKNNWIKIAALLILVIGAGMIGYLFFNNREAPQEIALNKASVPSFKNEPDSIKPLAADANNASILSQQNDVATNTEKNAPFTGYEAGREPNFKKSQQAANDADLSSAGSSNIYSDEKLNNNTPEASAMMAERSSKKVFAPQFEFNGKVIGTDGEPLPFATIYGSNNDGVIADTKGKFTISAPDSIMEIKVLAQGYISQKTTIKSTNSNNVIIVKEQQEKGLAETVIGEMTRRKKNDIIAIKNITFTKNTGVEPLEGWPGYQQYLETKFKEKNQDNLKGFVTIEFKINAKGIPYNFRAIQFDNPENYMQMIEILEQGPKWNSKTPNSLGRIEINF